MTNDDQAERILRHYATGLQKCVGQKIEWKEQYQHAIEEAIRLLFDVAPEPIIPPLRQDNVTERHTERTASRVRSEPEGYDNPWLAKDADFQNWRENRRYEDERPT